MTRLSLPPLLLAATLLLTACGGGGAGGQAFSGALSAESAQGYAADASTVPVGAAAAVDVAVDALAAAIPPAGMHALAEPVAPAMLLLSASCANGGTLAWTVAGPTPEQEANGRLDPDETYTLTFAGCVTADDTRLDGGLTLVVGSHGDGASDLTLAANSLRAITATGQYILNGSVRRQLTTVQAAAGGTQTTRRLTSSGLRVATAIGTRQASYLLTSLDWTIVRTDAADGTRVARTHQGTLMLSTSTPRRPDATLQIATGGRLTLAADGLAAQGSLVVTTSNDRIAAVWADGTVALSLDLGNDGSVDRTWTLTRAAFAGSAG